MPIGLDSLSISEAAKDKLRAAGVRSVETINRRDLAGYKLAKADTDALEADLKRMGFLPKAKAPEGEK